MSAWKVGNQSKHICSVLENNWQCVCDLINGQKHAAPPVWSFKANLEGLDDFSNAESTFFSL